MESLKAFASKKVAGIPVLYILLIVAAVALYGALRMKGNAPVDEAGDTLPEDSADDTGDLPDTSQPVFSATPVIMQPSGPSVSATPMEDNNELWGRRAIEWLTANGVTLTVASSAITKYLAGDSLSMQEGVARDRAVKQFGLPPEGLLTADVVNGPAGGSAPATKQGTPPVTHTVKSARDNNPRELARVYYGLTNADAINLIKSANTTLTAPYAVGTKVRIPRFVKPTYFRATSAARTLYKIAAKNGTSADRVQSLNPGMKFPVAVGTRVRVK